MASWSCSERFFRRNAGDIRDVEGEENRKAASEGVKGRKKRVKQQKKIPTQEYRD
jgi:hypothetical protein